MTLPTPIIDEKMSSPTVINESVPAVAVPMGNYYDSSVAVPMGSDENQQASKNTRTNTQEKVVSADATRSCLLAICSCFFCPLVISPMAIFFGLRAKKEIKENPEIAGDCQASSGIATAIMAFVLWIALMIVGYAMYSTQSSYGN
jgi:hypothetical protein